MNSILRVLSIVSLLCLLVVQVTERSSVSAFVNNMDQSPSSILMKDTYKLKANCVLGSEALIGANFKNRRFLDANLSTCKLVQADFSKAILTDTNLSLTDCRGANFAYANMYGIDVRGADLQNAIFKHTNLAGMSYNNNTKFTGARFDKHTEFPIDFIPEAHGMVNDND